MKAAHRTGYSGKSLIGKLGYQSGESVLALAEPDWFRDYLADNDVIITRHLPATWAHCFFTAASELEAFCKHTDLKQIEKALWVSWPKKASKVQTDLTEQTFRDVILPLGWVDTKIAAIDDTWSGLKFYRRR